MTPPTTTTTLVTRARAVPSRAGRTRGYDLDTKGACVTRTEEEIKAFHRAAVAKLAKKLNQPAAVVEQTLAFPLKEFKTGLEMVPGVVLVGALYAFTQHAEMDAVPATGAALALSSLVMLFVMAFGMARLPVTWSGAKRVQPVQEYLARVRVLLDQAGLAEDYQALVEPPQVPDWPSRMGDIDLDAHDLPHDSAATEWWYYNSHLLATSEKTGETKKLSFFASFFRVVKHVDEAGNKYHGHALTWAIADASSGAYYADVVLEPDAPKIILESVEKGISFGPSDAFLRKAFLDVLRKNQVPKPDRLMSKEATASTTSLALDLDGSTLTKDEATGTSLTEVENARWTSVRSFRSYPVAFKLVVPQAEMDLTVSASFPDQEFMTILSKPAFWEGRCDVVGTVRGRRVTGLAFLERNGFDPDQTLSNFFKTVGVAVRDSVISCYPLHPTQEQAVDLFATPETRHYMDDVPLDILGEKLIGPVRLITDRGGKSWRSYAALACVDAVGGDARKYAAWLAFPELLHVGSLVVDDIQDRSATRRGGPAAHHVYGEPLCINAGTAAYFTCEQLLDVPELSYETRVKCYKLYFACLRAGHAGQALDIHGNDYMMDEVVETGNADLLRKRILAIHRLKTAAPAGTLARLGATVGGGTDAQIEAIGQFMEAVGVAFQIMDDVLNLKGIYAKDADKLKKGTMLKTLGEDIMEGKITFPVAMFLGKCKDKDARKRMWDTIKSKPQDRAVVDAVIAELDAAGAIDDSATEARDIVDAAWAKLEGAVPPSFSLIMLRAFGEYVVRGM